MSRRFLSRKDMREAKRSEEIFNSLLKRKQVKNAHLIRSQRHVVCGCGAEGCIFISCVREEETESNNRK